jgi:hypothetical protein
MRADGKNESQYLHSDSGKHERRHGSPRVQQKERRYSYHPSRHQQKKSCYSHASTRLLDSNTDYANSGIFIGPIEIFDSL